MTGFDHRHSRTEAGFTLIEVLFASVLLILLGGGILYGYFQAARTTDWQAHSLAAESMAMERLEQTRAASWDTKATPPVDQLVNANFPVLVQALNLPVVGTNYADATDYTAISTVSVSPPLRMIQVDCVWQFTDGKIYTNTVVTYRSPDQ
ncbi:MAG: hypothetical protein KGR98_12760 [Verrucomicrobia bacterium]|nr:hypothetical protein [Verrucomicrobiota bacterium]MDE3099747.1 hypothetical protein [Verrucomicrobiota bacterium]